jgi:hypothetical protein
MSTAPKYSSPQMIRDAKSAALLSGTAFRARQAISQKIAKVSII